MAGINPNHTSVEDGFSALTLAVVRNQPGYVRALAASRGINIDQQSPQRSNRTALHSACAHPSPCLQFILFPKLQ